MEHKTMNNSVANVDATHQTGCFLNKICLGLPGYDYEIITGILIIVVIILIILLIRSFRKKSKGVKPVSTLDNGVVEKLKIRERELLDKIDTLNNSLEQRFKDGAVYSLNLLQREGRFVDFIKEDISNYEDAQIGAAVRQIHSGCKKIFTENFMIKPIFSNTEEGAQLTLNENFDPSEIRITGNMPSSAPFNGILRHKGWISEKVELPKRTGNINVKVVAPAEVEF